MKHIETLKQHEACQTAIDWASQYHDFATAWDACYRPNWMLWLHNEGIIAISDADLRLFACDCVRYTPIGDGRTVWDLLTDERSRNAVEVAERYANGDATEDELNAARDAAWYSAWAAGAAARDAAWAAWDTARDAAEAAGEAAGTFQADLLRKRIGNPFTGGIRYELWNTHNMLEEGLYDATCEAITNDEIDNWLEDYELPRNAITIEVAVQRIAYRKLGWKAESPITPNTNTP
jgi:hypothetical protein